MNVAALLDGSDLELTDASSDLSIDSLAERLAAEPQEPARRGAGRKNPPLGAVAAASGRPKRFPPGTASFLQWKPAVPRRRRVRPDAVASSGPATFVARAEAAAEALPSSCTQHPMVFSSGSPGWERTVAEDVRLGMIQGSGTCHGRAGTAAPELVNFQSLSRPQAAPVVHFHLAGAATTHPVQSTGSRAGETLGLADSPLPVSGAQSVTIEGDSHVRVVGATPAAPRSLLTRHSRGSVCLDQPPPTLLGNNGRSGAGEAYDAPPHHQPGIRAGADPEMHLEAQWDERSMAERAEAWRQSLRHRAAGSPGDSRPAAARSSSAGPFRVHPHLGLLPRERARVLPRRLPEVAAPPVRARQQSGEAESKRGDEDEDSILSGTRRPQKTEYLAKKRANRTRQVDAPSTHRIAAFARSVPPQLPSRPCTAAKPQPRLQMLPMLAKQQVPKTDLEVVASLAARALRPGRNTLRRESCLVATPEVLKQRLGSLPMPSLATFMAAVGKPKHEHWPFPRELHPSEAAATAADLLRSAVGKQRQTARVASNGTPRGILAAVRIATAGGDASTIAADTASGKPTPLSGTLGIRPGRLDGAPHGVPSEATCNRAIFATAHARAVQSRLRVLRLESLQLAGAIARAAAMQDQALARQVAGRVRAALSARDEALQTVGRLTGRHRIPSNNSSRSAKLMVAVPVSGEAVGLLDASRAAAVAGTSDRTAGMTTGQSLAGRFAAQVVLRGAVQSARSDPSQALASHEDDNGTPSAAAATSLVRRFALVRLQSTQPGIHSSWKGMGAQRYMLLARQWGRPQVIEVSPVEAANRLDRWDARQPPISPSPLDAAAAAASVKASFASHEAVRAAFSGFRLAWNAARSRKGLAQVVQRRCAYGGAQAFLAALTALRARRQAQLEAAGAFRARAILGRLRAVLQAMQRASRDQSRLRHLTAAAICMAQMRLVSRCFRSLAAWRAAAPGARVVVVGALALGGEARSRRVFCAWKELVARQVAVKARLRERASRRASVASPSSRAQGSRSSAMRGRASTVASSASAGGAHTLLRAEARAAAASPTTRGVLDSRTSSKQPISGAVTLQTPRTVNSPRRRTAWRVPVAWHETTKQVVVAGLALLRAATSHLGERIAVLKRRSSGASGTATVSSMTGSAALAFGAELCAMASSRRADGIVASLAQLQFVQLPRRESLKLQASAHVTRWLSNALASADEEADALGPIIRANQRWREQERTRACAPAAVKLAAMLASNSSFADSLHACDLAGMQRTTAGTVASAAMAAVRACMGETRIGANPPIVDLDSGPDPAMEGLISAVAGRARVVRGLRQWRTHWRRVSGAKRLLEVVRRNAEAFGLRQLQRWAQAVGSMQARRNGSLASRLRLAKVLHSWHAHARMQGVAAAENLRLRLRLRVWRVNAVHLAARRQRYREVHGSHMASATPPSGLPASTTPGNGPSTSPPTVLRQLASRHTHISAVSSSEDQWSPVSIPRQFVPDWAAIARTRSLVQRALLRWEASRRASIASCFLALKRLVSTPAGSARAPHAHPRSRRGSSESSKQTTPKSPRRSADRPGSESEKRTHGKATAAQPPKRRKASKSSLARSEALARRQHPAHAEIQGKTGRAPPRIDRPVTAAARRSTRPSNPGGTRLSGAGPLRPGSDRLTGGKQSAFGKLAAVRASARSARRPTAFMDSTSASRAHSVTSSGSGTARSSRSTRDGTAKRGHLEASRAAGHTPHAGEPSGVRPRIRCAVAKTVQATRSRSSSRNRARTRDPDTAGASRTGGRTNEHRHGVRRSVHAAIPPASPSASRGFRVRATSTVRMARKRRSSAMRPATAPRPHSRARTLSPIPQGNSSSSSSSTSSSKPPADARRALSASPLQPPAMRLGVPRPADECARRAASSASSVLRRSAASAAAASACIGGSDHPSTILTAMLPVEAGSPRIATGARCVGRRGEAAVLLLRRWLHWRQLRALQQWATVVVAQLDAALTLQAPAPSAFATALGSTSSVNSPIHASATSSLAEGLPDWGSEDASSGVPDDAVLLETRLHDWAAAAAHLTAPFADEDATDGGGSESRRAVTLARLPAPTRAARRRGSSAGSRVEKPARCGQAPPPAPDERYSKPPTRNPRLAVSARMLKRRSGTQNATASRAKQSAGKRRHAATTAGSALASSQSASFGRKRANQRPKSTIKATTACEKAHVKSAPPTESSRSFRSRSHVQDSAFELGVLPPRASAAGAGASRGSAAPPAEPDRARGTWGIADPQRGRAQSRSLGARAPSSASSTSLAGSASSRRAAPASNVRNQPAWR